jgi:hypothetical protein
MSIELSQSAVDSIFAEIISVEASTVDVPDVPETVQALPTVRPSKVRARKPVTVRRVLFTFVLSALTTAWCCGLVSMVTAQQAAGHSAAWGPAPTDAILLQAVTVCSTPALIAAITLIARIVNNSRLHSELDYQTPVEYEDDYYNSQQARTPTGALVKH